MSHGELSVLFLNMWNVAPPKSGGDHSVLGLALSVSQYAKCTLATVDESIDGVTACDSIGNLEIIKLPARDYRHAFLSRLSTPRTLYGNTATKRALRYANSRQLRLALKALTKEHNAVVVTHPWMWPTLKSALDDQSVAVIYDAHNVEHLLLQSSAESALVRFFSARAALSIEKDLCSHASQVWCCTEEDATSFGNSFGDELKKKYLTGFKGRNPTKSNPTTFNERSRSAVFVGSAWEPNKVAATFINEILAPELPNIDFHIVGSVGSSIANPSENVRIRGHIADLDEELFKHRVALNPTSTGSGINIKMLDYMATGTPIITTAFGARGFLNQAEPVMKTFALDDFGQELARLMSDEPYWTARSANARQSFGDQFTWEKIGIKAAAGLSDSVKDR